jgi:hypothetical protein
MSNDRSLPACVRVTAAKKATVAKRKLGPAKKASNAAKRSPRLPLAPSAVQAEKLTCRYCGSDDLAPSFIKRRDARCRACFKQLYGSAANKKDTQTGKGSAAK